MSHTDSSTEAILAKLAAMQATLDTQQAAIVALQEENARLHAALSAEPATPSVVAPVARDDTHDDAPEVAAEAGAHTRGGLTSRRSLLRGAAAATAAASVGAVALGAAQPAHAAPLADGGNLIIGQPNTETSTTLLTSSASTLQAVFRASTFATEYHSAAIYGMSQTGASGVIGADQSTDAFSLGSGVFGYSYNQFNGVGVRGETESGGVGVSGEVLDSSGTGTGVFGSTALGFGVVGSATSGWAVVGESTGGYDFVANGFGIIGVNVQGSVGAPTSGFFFIGDCIRDANGDLWLCTAGDGSTVGTWVKAAHAVAGMSGGAITYLSKPLRLLDTRPGQPAVNHPGSPYLAGSTHTITVSGASNGTVTVPSGCVGAIGNLTVIGLSGAGNFVELVPSGAGFQGTSNLNFAAGQLVANAYNVGLNVSGALDIILGSGGNADVILDVFAIIA